MNDDSWNYAGAAYVAAFRGRLDEIARTLGVRNQFNSKLGCAELLSGWGTIARITVEGEMGLPEKAKVVSQHPLGIDTQVLFQNVLLLRRIEFKVAP